MSDTLTAPADAHDPAAARTDDPRALPPVLGTVYLPKGGTAVGEFSFIVDKVKGHVVEIGTPVTAETAEGNLVGMVVDMSTVGTEDDPVMSELAGANRIANLRESIVARVQVFDSPKLRSVRKGTVRGATALEVQAAAGASRIDWTIPAGVIELADGTWANVPMDGHSLVGPEAAHLMVGGLSGQAAKSSFTGVLLRTLMARSRPGDTTAAVVINVKGADYCFLDRPPAAGKWELADDDLRMYEALGTPATPFDDVTVYAPGLPGHATGTRSDRDDAIALRWGLADIWPYLQYIYPWMYEDEKFMAWYHLWGAEYVKTRDHRRRAAFADLEAWFDSKLDVDEPQPWKGVHPATLMRLRRQMGSLPAQFGGLLDRSNATCAGDVPVDALRSGQVVVVDVANLPPNVQGLVIARTCQRLLQAAESEEGLGVDHAVVVADELNMFAPARGAEHSSVRKVLRRVSSQGRYAGISLWGAGQMLSKVDEEVRDNAASRAIGMTSESELSSGTYGRMPSGLAERLATLPRGYMALWHATFRAAMVVRFPRPAWQTGQNSQSAADRAKAAKDRPRNAKDVLGLPDDQVAILTEGLPDDVVEQVIADADDPVKAIEELRRHRIPDVHRGNLTEAPDGDPSDPFGLDG